MVKAVQGCVNSKRFTRELSTFTPFFKRTENSYSTQGFLKRIGGIDLDLILKIIP
jgi:hypothetical protein